MISDEKEEAGKQLGEAESSRLVVVRDAGSRAVNGVYLLTALLRPAVPMYDPMVKASSESRVPEFEKCHRKGEMEIQGVHRCDLLFRNFAIEKYVLRGRLSEISYPAI